MTPTELKNFYAQAMLVGLYPICSLCGRQIITIENFTFDHIIPKSMGGPDKLENLQNAHAKCNEERGNKHLKRTEETDETTNVTYVKIHTSDKYVSRDITITYGQYGQVIKIDEQSIPKRNKSKFKNNNGRGRNGRGGRGR